MYAYMYMYKYTRIHFCLKQAKIFLSTFVFHLTLLKKPVASAMNKLVAALALGTAGAETFVQGGTLDLTWKDCGDASTKAKISGLVPASLTLGQKTTVTGTGKITEGVSDGKIAVSLKASIISKSYSGDVCTAQTFTLPLGVGSIQYDGIKCPLAAGVVSVPVEVMLSSALPSSLAKADITVSATSTSGDKLFCMGITTAPKALGAGDYPIADGKTMVNAHHLIDAYNAVKETTWLAGHNGYFEESPPFSVGYIVESQIGYCHSQS